MKRIIPVSIIVISLWLLILSLINDNRGDVFSTVTQNYNDKPFIRIVAYHESCFGPTCGAIYVFESFKDDRWQEITTFRHDDPNIVPITNLKVENENLAYFWFDWTYGVSTDDGKTWSVWDVAQNNNVKNLINYKLITDVKIELNGRGKMIFADSKNQQSETIFLTTEDFGKTWHH